MELKVITEKDRVHEDWYKKARDISMDKLPEFLSHLMNDYRHDYGTVCHALAAGAIATAWAMDRSPQGGITGLQAGAVMWEFIGGWMYRSNKTGLKLVDYDNFLYPQYEDKFDKTISKETWEAIQKEAQVKIEEADREYEDYLIKADQYEEDVANFVKRYPDYYENRKHYDRLSCGTGAEWDAEKEKEESGFEFGPTEPCPPISKDGRVYLHWKAIVNGVVPFGYKVEPN